MTVMMIDTDSFDDGNDACKSDNKKYYDENDCINAEDNNAVNYDGDTAEADNYCCVIILTYDDIG